MFSSLWNWVSPSSSSSSAATATVAADRPNSVRVASSTHAGTATAASGPEASSEGGEGTTPSKKNRKKRQQRKKKKRQSAVLLAANITEDDDEDDEDAEQDSRTRRGGSGGEREPDELLQEDEDAERRQRLEEEAFPEADEDTAYLDRLCALDTVGDSEATSAATGTDAAGPSSGNHSATSRPVASAAATDSTTPTVVPPESLAVDDLVASMLAQGKTHPGPTGPLQRVHNLPDGAGQAPGLPLVKSTAESRRKAVEHGLVPITDEHGTLRVGFRIRDDIVLMHPKDLKGEPVLLRM